MKKIKVRCVEEYIDISPNLFNVLIYRVINGGWSNFSTYQCIVCREILLAENIESNNLYSFIEGMKCPNCKSILSKNIIKYPEKLMINNLIIISSFNEDYIKNIEESKIYDFYLLSR